MSKRFVVAALAVFALAWARPSAADTISFDPNGSGGGADVINATLFDWLPGNTLLIENGDGTATVLYQANLGTITAEPFSSTFTNGVTNGVYYTAVASFDVTLTATGFTIDPGGTFQIYADNSGTASLANNLAGTGFTDGTVILTGTATAGFGSLTPTGATATLDQWQGDSYGGLQSIVGSGGFNVDVRVLSVDANYFLQTPNTMIVSTNSDGSNNLPFNKVDPSRVFFNGEAGATAVGPVNGLCINTDPCKIIAQSDASTTFTTVPEPASLTLLGLGLAGSAAARRRQKKASQAQA